MDEAWERYLRDWEKRQKEEYLNDLDNYIGYLDKCASQASGASIEFNGWKPVKSKTPYCPICESVKGMDHEMWCFDRSIDWLDLMRKLK